MPLSREADAARKRLKRKAVKEAAEAEKRREFRVSLGVEGPLPAALPEAKALPKSSEALPAEKASGRKPSKKGQKRMKLPLKHGGYGTHQGAAKRALRSKPALLIPHDSQPWDLQMTDTPKRFEAFVIYRDMGSDRNLKKVAEEQGKSRQLISEWSMKDNWLQRVTLYDRWKDQQLQKAQEKDALEALKRHLMMVNSVQTKLIARLIATDLKNLTESELVEATERMIRLERTLREVDKKRLDVGVTVAGDPEKPLTIKFVVEQMDSEIERREAEFARRMAARSDAPVAKLAGPGEDGLPGAAEGDDELEASRSPRTIDAAFRGVGSGGGLEDLADPGGEVLGED